MKMGKHNIALPSKQSICLYILTNLCLQLSVAVGQYYSHDESYNYYYSDNNGHAGMGEYLRDWNHDWAKMTGRIQQPKCIDIPRNLTLCYKFKYEQMMLPNLLEHDSLKEVVQQAKAWVHLINIKCHPDSQMFLCSLFSPVCLEKLDRLIYPCRSLCEAVESHCSYRMKVHGFEWPDMLNCSKFPEENDMCIKLIHDIKPDNNCSSCKHAVTYESLIDHYCRADIVMRATVKDFRVNGNDRELQLRKKKKFYKHDGIEKKKARRLIPIIKGGALCTCETINATQERYLLMGRVHGNRLIIDFGMVWRKKDRDFKKGLRAIRKESTCEKIFSDLSESANQQDKNIRKKKGETEERLKKRRGGRKKKREGRKNRNGRRRKGRKRRKGQKGRRNGNSKRNGLSMSEIEDKAMDNFMKASN